MATGNAGKMDIDPPEPIDRSSSHSCDEKLPNDARHSPTAARPSFSPITDSDVSPRSATLTAPSPSSRSSHSSQETAGATSVSQQQAKLCLVTAVSWRRGPKTERLSEKAFPQSALQRRRGKNGTQKIFPMVVWCQIFNSINSLALKAALALSSKPLYKLFKNTFKDPVPLNANFKPTANCLYYDKAANKMIKAKYLFHLLEEWKGLDRVTYIKSTRAPNGVKFLTLARHKAIMRSDEQFKQKDAELAWVYGEGESQDLKDEDYAVLFKD